MTNERLKPYKQGRYDVAQDIFEEIIIMTDFEYQSTAHNFDEFLLSSAISANDAIKKMMKID